MIAQRAMLDVEREAHERTRVVAARALELARRAMTRRRMAIKIARRERRARLELEARVVPDIGTRRRNAASVACEGGVARESAHG